MLTITSHDTLPAQKSTSGTTIARLVTGDARHDQETMSSTASPATTPDTTSTSSELAAQNNAETGGFLETTSEMTETLVATMAEARTVYTKQGFNESQVTRLFNYHRHADFINELI